MSHTQAYCDNLTSHANQHVSLILPTKCIAKRQTIWLSSLSNLRTFSINDKASTTMQPWLLHRTYPRNTCSMWHHQPFRRIFSVSLSSFPKGVNTAEVPLAKGLSLPKPSGHLEGVPHPSLRLEGCWVVHMEIQTTRIPRDAKWQLYRYLAKL